MKTLQLDCPGIALRIRRQPNFGAEVIGVLRTDSIVDVLDEQINSFYVLADGAGFVISSADGIQWFECAQDCLTGRSASDTDDIRSDISGSPRAADLSTVVSSNARSMLEGDDDDDANVTPMDSPHSSNLVFPTFQYVPQGMVNAFESAVYQVTMPLVPSPLQQVDPLPTILPPKMVVPPLPSFANLASAKEVDANKPSSPLKSVTPPAPPRVVVPPLPAFLNSSKQGIASIGYKEARSSSDLSPPVNVILSSSPSKPAIPPLPIVSKLLIQSDISNNVNANDSVAAAAVLRQQSVDMHHISSIESHSPHSHNHDMQVKELHQFDQQRQNDQQGRSIVSISPQITTPCPDRDSTTVVECAFEDSNSNDRGSGGSGSVDPNRISSNVSQGLESSKEAKQSSQVESSLSLSLSAVKPSRLGKLFICTDESVLSPTVAHGAQLAVTSSPGSGSKESLSLDRRNVPGLSTPVIMTGQSTSSLPSPVSCRTPKQYVTASNGQNFAVPSSPTATRDTKASVSRFMDFDVAEMDLSDRLQ